MWKLLSLVISFTCVTFIFPQSCREYSQTCDDAAACCGGCCLNGICRDTYADCRLGDDPCSDVYCPPDEECYVYQATDCGGCGPTTQCRSAPVAPEEKKPHGDDTTKNGQSRTDFARETYMHLPSLVIFMLLNFIIS